MRVYLEEKHIIPLIKGVYNRSKPAGLGFLHYRPGPLTDEEAATLINDEDGSVYMDYVAGRCCKFNIFSIFIRGIRKRYIEVFPGGWFDHSDEDFYSLLLEAGVFTANDFIEKGKSEEDLPFIDELLAAPSKISGR